MNAMYETPAIREILKTAYAEDVFMPNGKAAYLSQSIELARRHIGNEEGLSSEGIRLCKQAGTDASIS